MLLSSTGPPIAVETDEKHVTVFATTQKTTKAASTHEIVTKPITNRPETFASTKRQRTGTPLRPSTRAVSPVVPSTLKTMDHTSSETVSTAIFTTVVTTSDYETSTLEFSGHKEDDEEEYLYDPFYDGSGRSTSEDYPQVVTEVFTTEWPAESPVSTQEPLDLFEDFPEELHFLAPAGGTDLASIFKDAELDYSSSYEDKSNHLESLTKESGLELDPSDQDSPSDIDSFNEQSKIPSQASNHQEGNLHNKEKDPLGLENESTKHEYDSEPLSQENGPFSRENGSLDQDPGSQSLSQEDDLSSQIGYAVSEESKSLTQENDQLSQEEEPLSQKLESESLSQESGLLNEENEPLSQEQGSDSSQRGNQLDQKTDLSGQDNHSNSQKLGLESFNQQSELDSISQEHGSLSSDPEIVPEDKPGSYLKTTTDRTTRSLRTGRPRIFSNPPRVFISTTHEPTVSIVRLISVRKLPSYVSQVPATLRPSDECNKLLGFSMA